MTLTSGLETDVTDFRVEGKVVKAFLAIDLKYSHTLHLKASMAYVEK